MFFLLLQFLYLSFIYFYYWLFVFWKRDISLISRVLYFHYLFGWIWFHRKVDKPISLFYFKLIVLLFHFSSHFKLSESYYCFNTLINAFIIILLSSELKKKISQALNFFILMSSFSLISFCEIQIISTISFLRSIIQMSFMSLIIIYLIKIFSEQEISEEE